MKKRDSKTAMLVIAAVLIAGFGAMLCIASRPARRSQAEHSSQTSAQTERSTERISDARPFFEKNTETFLPPLPGEDTEEQGAFIIEGVENIYQKSPPALPTGCEVTSLAAVMRYYGADVTKNELADEWLDKGEISYTDGEMTAPDPYDAFVGSPYDSTAYGCYSPVIERCANAYFEAKGIPLRAAAYRDRDIEFFLSYVEKGQPVLLWTTISLRESYISGSWLTPDGREVYWHAGEHCMVCAGIDRQRGLILCADPLVDSTEPVRYDLEQFTKCFYEQGGQGVVFSGPWADGT